MTPAGTGVSKSGTPLVGADERRHAPARQTRVGFTDQRCCAACWAWSGAACRSGVSCGGVCTVTRVPGDLPARPLHGYPSMGEALAASHLQYPRYVANTLSTSPRLGGQAARQVAQLSARRVLHGEQVRDELADQNVSADQFWGDLLGLEQRGDRLVRLAALGVRAGRLDEQPGAAF